MIFTDNVIMIEISITDKEDLYIVNIIGELTIASVGSFKQKILPLFQAKKKTVALDLINVTFIDSTGIGNFVEAMNSAKINKKEFILFNLNDKIKETFKVVGLKNFFKVMEKKDFELKYL
jgi:anti-sigma B factor antagonist